MRLLSTPGKHAVNLHGQQRKGHTPDTPKGKHHKMSYTYELRLRNRGVDTCSTNMQQLNL